MIEIRDIPAGGRVTEPGLYRMTAEQYHADPCPVPSLSSGAIRKMLERTPRHAFCEHPRLGRQLDEGIGQSLAEWARGKAPSPVLTEAERERLAKIEANGYDAADMGMPALVAFWKGLSKSDQVHFQEIKDGKWKPRAEATTAAAA